MEISDVRVRLLTDTHDRLKAVCSVTLGDQFVIRDIKLVDGTGGLFVAMPSRKLSAPCPQCKAQNHLRAKYCNECGKRVPITPIPKDDNGREKAHRDIAHPITSTFRQAIQARVLEAYEEERRRDSGEADRIDEREKEPIAAAPEAASNDYNSMIADLDPGRGRNRHRNTHGAPTEQKSDRRGNRGRDHRRNRHRDPEKSDEDRTEPTEKVAQSSSPSSAKQNARRESPPTAPREPAQCACSSSGSGDHIDQDETAFGWGLDEVAEPQPVQHDPAPSKIEKEAPSIPTPSHEDPDEDELGFGAGIL